MLIVRVNELCHRLLGDFVREGDSAADCTAGNGHDSLFLAQAVGRQGHLYAFDVQREAVARTRTRLLAAGVEEGRFTLLCESHERIALHAPAGLAAVVYNLGYLPGGDRARVTERDGTIRSVRAALGLLRPGGVAVLTLYRGHEGGAQEAEGLLDMAARLVPGLYAAAHLRYANMPNEPPELLLIQRLPGAPSLLDSASGVVKM